MVIFWDFQWNTKENMEEKQDEILRAFREYENFLLRWARTHNRVCPITGREVTLLDIEQGKYYVSRINGDSAFGYEVQPTREWALDLIQNLLDRVESFDLGLIKSMVETHITNYYS